jgi:hypothetical protein
MLRPISGKRGQFFGIYLVFLTIFMCGLVAVIYHIQEKDLENSLISPQVLLRLEDEKNLFEIQEKEFIIDSARDVGWMAGDFADDVKTSFCGKFPDLMYARFIFSNISYKGRNDWGDAFDSPAEKEKFCLNVYDFGFEENILKVNRGEIGKNIRLSAVGKTKTNFVVDVDYVFDKEYLIKAEDIN